MLILSYVITAMLMLLLSPVDAHQQQNHHDHYIRNDYHSHSHHGGNNDNHNRNGLGCGTHDPTLEQVKLSEILLHEYKKKKTNSRHLQASQIIIPVCFHVIRSNTTYSPVIDTDSGLQLQLDALNRAFSTSSCCNTTLNWCNTGDCSVASNFRFEMAIFQTGSTKDLVSNQTSPNVNSNRACVTRTVNDKWYRSSSSSKRRNKHDRILRNSYYEQEMKRTLRKGGSNVLNIYFNDIKDSDGYATYPIEYKDNPDLDGVIVNDDTIAGSDTSYRNEGDMLVHGVGHWLGLYHPYAGYDCNGGGDGIIDTPAQYDATNYYECPIGQDTCPKQDGNDPIHNFMDNGSDECRYEFTPDQVMLMQAQYEIYRDPDATQERPVIILKPGNASDPIVLTRDETQTYKMDIQPNDRVLCDVVGEAFDSELYFRFGSKPNIYNNNGGYDCYKAYDDGYDDLFCFLKNENDATSVFVTILAEEENLEALSVVCTIYPPLPAETTLVTGDTSSSFDVADDEVVLFKMIVKGAYAVACKTTDGSGYLDLYLRYNEPPNLDSEYYEYDCEDSGDKTTATCIVPYQDGADTIYAAIKGEYGAFDIVITCTAIATVDDGVPPEILTLGSVIDIANIALLDAKVFKYQTVGPEEITCSTTGSNGDVDLFMKFVSQGDILSNDCVSTDPNSNEDCSVSVPGLSWDALYVTVLPLTTEVEDVTLECSTKLDLEGLSDGRSSSISYLSAEDFEVFKLNIDPEKTYSVICTLRSDDSNADLYVGLDAIPDVVNEMYDCSSANQFTSDENCVISNTAAASEVYALVYATTNVDDKLYVTCLTLGDEVEPIVKTLAIGEATIIDLTVCQSNLYEVDVGTTGNVVTCTTSSGDRSGDADLYLRWDNIPQPSKYTCASETYTSNESCTVRDKPNNDSKLFVQVKAYRTFTGVKLVCELVDA